MDGQASSRGGPNIRVGSWNVLFGQADDRLVAEQDFDLLCLQECTPPGFERFKRHFDWGFSAMDPEWLGGVTTKRTHGVAVLGRARFDATVRPPPPRLLAPEKLLAVDLRGPGGMAFTVASYHAYAGRKGPDELDKPRLTSQVAMWAEAEDGPTILAMDANSPWVDHPDPDQVECCFDTPDARHFERRLLHVSEARHGLNDALRTWLADHPDALARIRADRPTGPLAVSHRTGRTNERLGNPRRYDHIYASADFEVRDVQYLYDEAIEAGSDHALVVCELTDLRAGRAPVPGTTPSRDRAT